LVVTAIVRLFGAIDQGSLYYAKMNGGGRLRRNGQAGITRQVRCWLTRR